MIAFKKIKESIDIIIPVKKAFLYIETKDLFNNIAYEEIFLFIGDGKKFEDLIDITTYSNDQLDAILVDFFKWKLMDGNDYNQNKNFTLTALGQQLYRVVEEKHNFNDKNIEVFINCFSGNIEKIDRQYKDSVDKELLVLENKLDINLFTNLNQGYSKEFYEDTFKTTSISDDDMSHIKIRIEIHDKKTYYITKKLSSLPNLIQAKPIFSLNNFDLSTSLKNPNKDESFNITGSILNFTLSYENTSLSQYTDIISKLNEVFTFKPHLITNEGLQIIESFEKQNSINKLLSNNILSLDTFNGDIYKSAIFEKNNIKSNLTVDKLYDLKDLDKATKKQLLEIFIDSELLSYCVIRCKFEKEISVIQNINFEFLE